MGSAVADRLVEVEIERAHPDGAGRGCLAARRPPERPVERIALQKEEAAELFLRLGERSVLDVALPALDSKSRGAAGLLERHAAGESNAGGDQSLVVRAPGGHVPLVLLGHSGGE